MIQESVRRLRTYVYEHNVSPWLTDGRTGQSNLNVRTENKHNIQNPMRKCEVTLSPPSAASAEIQTHQTRLHFSRLELSSFWRVCAQCCLRFLFGLGWEEWNLTWSSSVVVVSHPPRGWMMMLFSLTMSGYLSLFSSETLLTVSYTILVHSLLVDSDILLSALCLGALLKQSCPLRSTTLNWKTPGYQQIQKHSNRPIWTQQTHHSHIFFSIQSTEPLKVSEVTKWTEIK